MKGWTYYVAMVVVQLALGGSNILMKVSLDRGLDLLVFVVYRHLIAMVLLGPFAFALERKQRPSLSLSILTKIFVLSSLGTTIHLYLFYAGLAYTTPTVAGALSNVIPSLTFVLALLLRMEKLKITSIRGQAKVAGTLICVGGSLIFSLWKGGFLLKGFVKKPLIHLYHYEAEINSGHGKESWIKGSIFILTSYVAWSAFLVLQALVFKVYPAQLSLNTMICFFASLQCSLLALCFGIHPTLWRLDWNVQLLTIVYCGVVISGIVYVLQTWCIGNRGPVFTAMFSPLLLIIGGISSAIAFAERLHLASLVGAFFIIVGLYCVLWGKQTDNHVADEQPGSQNGEETDNNKRLDISVEDGLVMNPVSNKGREQYGRKVSLESSIKGS
ncbi:WAT1-related protein At5g64700 [Morus notabilis]|uniref:WAT1-related protein At5g64700 n=1 Tax=Morus notabilis TaxID=981085 RepID=UPI000CECF3D0|nr:WAT1-related protein At5g64700 [Morus notabilis]